MHIHTKEGMCKFRKLGHAPGLAFEWGGGKLVFCGFCFSSYGRWLSYCSIFWHRMQLVCAGGEI